MADLSETAAEGQAWIERPSGLVVPIDYEKCPALWAGNDAEGLQDKFPCELPRGHEGVHRYTAEWDAEWTFQSGDLKWERVS